MGEDQKEIAEQQAQLERYRQELYLRQVELDGVQRELNNRLENDRIFSSAEFRRLRTGSPMSQGQAPPLPGRRVGEVQNFADRQETRCRSQSAHRFDEVTSSVVQQD